MKCIEEVLTFRNERKRTKAKAGIIYNPPTIRPLDKPREKKGSKTKIYHTEKSHTVTHTGYPTHFLEYKRERDIYHDTQKPVDLLKFLIETYTDENDTVLDFTMGSGSTGVAAVKSNRGFIGIERDEHYYNIAQERIQGAQEE